ncbi:MAG: sucrose-specific PTS transporter subunit IIBC [Aerococcus sp.]|nr:sucrose-specific PTS transporter subunit IIBC [Aerococcus sp.]
MNHEAVAKRIADAIGKDNITSAAHCATRLRLVLKDDQKVDQEALDADPDLKGTFRANGQYQIIVGPGDVADVYKYLTKLTGAHEVSTSEAKEEATSNNRNILIRLVKVLSDIFVPLIPALTAGGLLLALNNVFVSEGLFGSQSLVEMYPSLTDLAAMINTFAGAAFTFLPVLIGYSATKRFGGNAYLGAIMGIIMVLPSLVSGYDVANVVATGEMPTWNLFGFHVAQAGYQGQVLPVVGVAWILSQIEKFFHKHLNDALDFTFTPLFAILLTGMITFSFVGPLLRSVSDIFLNGVIFLINYMGPFGYGIFGFFYSAIVLTGLHQSFPAITTQLLADISKTGGDFMFPIASVANVAQGGATFAYFFLTNNAKEKSLSSSAGLSALLGITEPAMFGVNLKHRYPFYIAMGASGISCFLLGVFNVKSVSPGPAGIIGFISIMAGSIKFYLLAELVAIALAFIGTYLFGKYKLRKTETEEALADKQALKIIYEDNSQAKSHKANNIVSSVELSAVTEGKTYPLTTVKDDVFSSLLLGKGVAIIPTGNTIYAPADGIISVAYETKHAYGISTTEGCDVLIHIGIDTVEMGGKGFTSLVEQGQIVSKGTPLGTYNYKEIQSQGYDPTIMMIITNSNDYSTISLQENKTVTSKDVVITAHT